MKHNVWNVYLMLNILAISRRVFATMASEGLVKEKLAGCVNIIPGIHSVYEWEGEIQKDSEVLMVIKSRTSQLDDLTKYVRENHPYQVCEVISTPIVQGNEPYLKWLNDIIPEKK
ncbi:protein CutA homolog [Caerostris extrusa]|uniref:Protein CutA homolog n=1 Tax=Caerostris extrusa TaxID=172846 RepID=A0AAV4PNV8_CAEEX|nr:protein CutA homolog [Caerostris extrusa]